MVLVPRPGPEIKRCSRTINGLRLGVSVRTTVVTAFASDHDHDSSCRPGMHRS